MWVGKSKKRDSWIMDQETVECNLTSLSRVEDVEALKLSSVSNVETFEASFWQIKAVA